MDWIVSMHSMHSMRFKILVDGAPFNAELHSHMSPPRHDQKKNFSIEGGTCLQPPLKVLLNEFFKIQINLSEGRSSYHIFRLYIFQKPDALSNNYRTTTQCECTLPIKNQVFCAHEWRKPWASSNNYPTTTQCECTLADKNQCFGTGSCSGSCCFLKRKK